MRMTEKDYRQKIRKLLSLAESPNENEARAALLKARQLMAEHNIRLRDLQDAGSRKVRREGVDGISFSKMINPWVADLSAVIGDAFCCKAFRSHYRGARTNTVGFIGLDGDIDACMAAFRYAYGYCLGKTQDIKKDNMVYNPKYRRRLMDSYGHGFVTGLGRQFMEQTKEHEQEWALVVTTPKKVQEEAESTLKKDTWDAPTAKDVSADMFFDGVRDGKNLNMNALERGEGGHGLLEMA